jgi:flavin-dependent dehydrogenase
MIGLAIAGAGMTGAYLYRRLKNEGRDADLFDPGCRSACGLTPCAWGTSRDFVGLVERAGLDAGKYILRRFDRIWMDDVAIRADLMTFDKPRLVRDLLQDAAIRPSSVPVDTYDRIIDATGVARALLPPIADDITMGCREYLVEAEEPAENRIRLGGVGYAWRFPLAGGLCHVGCGSLLADPQHILEGLGWIGGGTAQQMTRIRCGCSGRIRLTGPHESQPFVADGCRDGIWGVGEAIGCVAPLAGDGVVPGMRSVELLLANWDRPHEYAEAVLAEFAWMKEERAVVDRLRNAGHLGIREARVLKRNAKRMGLHVGLRRAVALLLHMR